LVPAAQIESYVAGGKDRVCYLIEQRLELLVVVLVDQRDPYIGIRCDLVSTVHTCKTAAHDYNVLNAVGCLLGRLIHSRRPPRTRQLMYK
jgi:hypothetical protein